MCTFYRKKKRRKTMPDGLAKWPYLPLKLKYANITIFGCKENCFWESYSKLYELYRIHKIASNQKCQESAILEEFMLFLLHLAWNHSLRQHFHDREIVSGVWLGKSYHCRRKGNIAFFPWRIKKSTKLFPGRAIHYVKRWQEYKWHLERKGDCV